MACLLSHLDIQVQWLLANMKTIPDQRHMSPIWLFLKRKSLREKGSFNQSPRNPMRPRLHSQSGTEQAVMFHGMKCYLRGSVCLLPFCKSCCCLKTPKVINLQRRKVCFGSQFGRVQSVVDGSCLWAHSKATYHSRRVWQTQTSHHLSWKCKGILVGVRIGRGAYVSQ